MSDFPGRGDVNPYGIPMPNPHERTGPDYDACVVCGDYSLEAHCKRCERNLEEDRLDRETRS